MTYYAAGFAPTTAYLAVKKLWDTLLHEQTQSQLFFKDMIGKDQTGEGSLDSPMSNYPIVEKTDLRKDSGDAITMSLARQLVTDEFYNAGKSGNKQLVDAETAMSLYTTKVYVAHWRDATVINGKQTFQQSPFKLRTVAKGLLADEISKFKDEGIFFALYWGYSPNVIREIGTSTLLEKLPLNNLYGKNRASYSALTTQDVVDTELLEILATVVEENNFNAINYEGQKTAFFVCHPRGMKTLRADSLFQDANINALPKNKENPMFSKAQGRWGGIFVASHASVRNGTYAGTLACSSDSITLTAPTAPTDLGNNTDVRLNLLIGANAVARAVALPEYMEVRKEDDYGNITGIGGGLIYGDRRADYQIDDGTGATFKNQSSICVASYSPAVASNFTQIWS